MAIVFAQLVQSTAQLSSTDENGKPISFSIKPIVAEKELLFKASNSFPCALLGDLEIGKAYLLNIDEKMNVYDSAKYDKTVSELRMTFNEIPFDEIITPMIKSQLKLVSVTFKDNSKEQSEKAKEVVKAKQVIRRAGAGAPISTTVLETELSQLKSDRTQTQDGVKIAEITAQIAAKVAQIKAINPLSTVVA